MGKRSTLLFQSKLNPSLDPRTSPSWAGHKSGSSPCGSLAPLSQPPTGMLPLQAKVNPQKSPTNAKCLTIPRDFLSLAAPFHGESNPTLISSKVWPDIESRSTRYTTSLTAGSPLTDPGSGKNSALNSVLAANSLSEFSSCTSPTATGTSGRTSPPSFRRAD